jgi:hypothetical protein
VIFEQNTGEDFFGTLVSFIDLKIQTAMIMDTISDMLLIYRNINKALLHIRKVHPAEILPDDSTNTLELPQVSVWYGCLEKYSLHRFWRSLWIELKHAKPEIDGIWVNSISCAVLIYHDDLLGEQRHYLVDVRREHALERLNEDGSKSDFIFSVGLLPSKAVKQGSVKCNLMSLITCAGPKRMRLRSTSDQSAAAFLLCLRRILQPDAELPTLLDAVHFPEQVLQTLS